MITPADTEKTVQTTADTKVSEPDSDELLRLYKETGDNEIKWQIVMRYTDYIKRVAFKTNGLYNSFAQMDDIVHEGVLVLLSAVERFDITKEVKFETYVSKRLRGMIVDLARKNDWLPRHLRQRAIKINKATDNLSLKLGRMPTSQEIADELGVTKEEYTSMISDTALTNLMSLEMLLDTYGNASGKLVSAADIKNAPDEILEEKAMFNSLKGCISKLRENEQLVLSLYYEKELTMKEIAHVMGVSAPRVSQIHSRAIQELRYFMDSEYKD